MSHRVRLKPVADSEEPEFLDMAHAYFTELNPSFTARDDWRNNYFSGLRSSPDMYLHWIQCERKRAGFVIYGIEAHRFLPRTNGRVYEFYILPQFRRTGTGREAAKEVFRVLQELSPAKIELEITCNNAAAAAFWQGFGFKKVAERYVLSEGHR